MKIVKVRKNLVGKIFGRLKVIKQIDDYVSKANVHYAKWFCQCDCGNTCCVIGTNLVKGATKSCGCLHKENPIQINGDVITIITFKGEKILIDTEDYSKIREHCWRISQTGYVTATIKGKPIYLHRFILNPSSDMEVDHINCNKADNRKENLRICRHYQNSKNIKKKSNNTSGIVGVTYDKRRNKWVARIWDNGKKIHLGEFKDIEDAIKTRKEAEIKYYGEYVYKGE